MVTRLSAFQSNPASFIDHTILKPNAIEDEIIQLCQEAKKYQFKSVCVNPFWVKKCVNLLKGTNVLVCTVIGFPLGANSIKVKAYETKTALEDGAGEIDMVMNVGKYLSDPSKASETLEEDVGSVVNELKASSVPLKVIIETSLLQPQQIQQVSQILGAIKGVSFVKTSTGFTGLGAQPEHLQLMRESLPEAIGVKASGGIKTLKDCIKMIEAGANRIGTSSGVKIMEEFHKNES
ncbi:hypothetical protein DFH28DRAFT_1106068 [Melampsora americana]|nr:hypothetical protein DFH28DRAFT_1106068 [Melampsora americana]